MVRAFVPQSFPGNIETNTNFPPQHESTIAPLPPVIDHELHEETLGVFGNIIYDETGGGNDGQVEISGG